MGNRDINNDPKEWQDLLDWLKTRFGKEPDMEAILFLIGINELRTTIPEDNFTKDQKQDLMHVAVCTLLSDEGYYLLEKYDDEGWPHFTKQNTASQKDFETQERLLKEKILNYFREML